MAWTKPKTDWSCMYDEWGKYLGDFFNAEDYNRIKNNIVYLYDLSKKLFPHYALLDMGADKVYKDFLYAEEINKISLNIKQICIHAGVSFTPALFNDNDNLFDYIWLNSAEEMLLKLYNILSAINGGRRQLKFELGERKVI